MNLKPSGPGVFLGHRRALRTVAALAVALVVTGCATPTQLPTGATRSEVIASLGTPQARHALPDGGERLEYSGDGLQQEAWMVDLGADGRVMSVRQVHTLEEFSRIKPGVDTQDTVRRSLGAPWQVARYRLSGLTAWSYPHMEHNAWYSLMTILFDDNGVVQRVENGPDPRFLGGRDRDD
jgi:hypothetical protein